MPALPAAPVRVTSFTDRSVAYPTQPPPGNLLDAEYDRTNAAVASLITFVSTLFQSDGTLKPASVGAAALASDITAQLTTISTAAGIVTQQHALKWAEYLAGPVIAPADAPAAIAASNIPSGLFYDAVAGGSGGLFSAKYWAVQAEITVNAFKSLYGAPGPSPTVQTVPLVPWTFNNTQTVFSLARQDNGQAITPTQSALLVFLNGYLQVPGTDFTVAGSNITFARAPYATEPHWAVWLSPQAAIAQDGVMITGGDHTTRNWNVYGVPVLQVGAKGAQNAIVGLAETTSLNNYPTGVTGVGVNSVAGGQAFGIYAEGHTRTPGTALGAEIDSFNDTVTTPDANLPPSRVMGTSQVVPIALTLAAGGSADSSLALQICREGGSPQHFLSGIYINDDAVKNYGLFIDANGANGPATSAVIKAKQAAIALQLQATGTASPGSSVLLIVNTSGVPTAAITQNGNIGTLGGLGVFGHSAPGAQPTVTGSRGGNAALASLLTALAATGLIIDGSSA